MPLIGIIYLWKLTTKDTIQPGAFIAHDGSAIELKNVICIHEEDDGVLWKHTDYRPNGRSHTVRKRRLVVSMVCTLANYGEHNPSLSYLVYENSC